MTQGSYSLNKKKKQKQLQNENFDKIYSIPSSRAIKIHFSINIFTRNILQYSINIPTQFLILLSTLTRGGHILWLFPSLFLLHFRKMLLPRVHKQIINNRGEHRPRTFRRISMHTNWRLCTSNYCVKSLTENHSTKNSIHSGDKSTLNKKDKKHIVNRKKKNQLHIGYLK